MKPDNDPLDALLGADPDEEMRPGFDTRFHARLAEHKAKEKSRRSWLYVVGLGGALAATAAMAVMSIAPSKTDEAQAALEIAYDYELYEDYDIVADLEVLELIASADAPKTDGVPQ